MFSYLLICIFDKKGNLFISFFRDVNMNLVFFCRLLVASRDMEAELVCVDSYGKKAGLGVLDGGGFMFTVPLHTVRLESVLHGHLFPAYCQARIRYLCSPFHCILSGKNQFSMPTFSLHTVRWESDLHVHLFSANCQVRIGPSRSFFSANCQVRIDCNATFTDYFSPVLMSLVPCKNNSLAAYRFLDILFSFVSVPQQCHFVKRTIRNANFQNSWTLE